MTTFVCFTTYGRPSAFTIFPFVATVRQSKLYCCLLIMYSVFFAAFLRDLPSPETCKTNLGGVVVQDCTPIPDFSDVNIDHIAIRPSDIVRVTDRGERLLRLHQSYASQYVTCLRTYRFTTFTWAKDLYILTVSACEPRGARVAAMLFVRKYTFTLLPALRCGNSTSVSLLLSSLRR